MMLFEVDNEDSVHEDFTIEALYFSADSDVN